MTRVAVVTGGTSGIGAAISAALQQAGCKVAAGYVGNEEGAKAFHAKTGIPIYKFDVSRFYECKAVVEQITKDLGTINVLVNNAGITKDVMLHKMTPEQWNDVININLNSMFNMTRHVIEGMRDQGFGRVINISSINGQKGQMGQTNYSASKAGIIGFTKALAQESAGKGITVNTIAPGYIKTEMVAAIKPEILDQIVAGIPVKRLGAVEEIAAAVVYLVSDTAGFMTGATLAINGGQYCSG
ncbi:MAG: acetoacetyl-CoA reductase [Alphaproteobacteria bacterium]|nr:acetoacetyl-CoA reductase [Alphaproteobacteria bacterium]MCL2505498.1 acetoacetyl-CoA reductase [Alphaproteobacteria bacterium]